MRLATALLLLLASGCARTPADRVEAPAPLPVGEDTTVVGTVATVDTDPWAYDGNAVLVVTTDAGDVRVEVPARTNLCAATELGLVTQLAPGEAVEVVGERTEAGAVVPCGRAAHGLRRR